MPADQVFPGIDPFMRFWSDFMSKMATAGTPAPQPPPDVVQQMRRVFFDTMAEQADQFLRSEAFLNSLKQGMEASLAWQQAMNQFLQKGLASAQIPTRTDADHLVTLLRNMEERIVDRVDDLSQRVEKLEGGNSKKAPPRKAVRSR